MLTVLWLFLAAIPLALSLWALLDVARRPAWAWSLAGRSQLAWLTAIAFGLFLVLGGLVIATWYLVWVRPRIAAVESGDLAGLEPPDRDD